MPDGKILIGTIFFERYELLYPYFLESLKNLYHRNFQVEIVDISKTENNLNPGMPNFSVLKKKQREDLFKQVADIRNGFLKKALDENFDYLLLIQPDILLSPNILYELVAWKKGIVVPAFFVLTPEGIDSNAFRAEDTSTGKNLVPLGINDLTPSNLYEVEFSLLDCVFFGRQILSKLEFKPQSNELAGMIAFCSDCKNKTIPLHLDSYNVVSKITPNKIFSVLYDKVFSRT